MVGFEMFCERCGTRYGNAEASNSTSLPLSKRLLKAVGVSASAPAAVAEEPLLRFCLACRGYSCSECWNDEAGFCQTCVPAEVPEVAQPIVDIPALDSPAPQMSFVSMDEMPPYLAMLAAQSGVLDAASADSAAEAISEAVAQPPTDELGLTADGAQASDEARAASAEDEAVADATFVAAPEPELEVETVAEVAQAEAAVAEVTPAIEAEADDVAVAAVATQTLALSERPIELVFGDEEMAAEPDAETAWDWDFVGETQAGPVDTHNADVEPIAASTDEGSTTDAGGLVDAPVVPAQPPVLPPPVYKPLAPLGPIMAPPPPPAAATPRIEFEMLEPPPAFVIAPPQQVVMRPQLPAGLFDGPGPQIRPCHQCDLPVSAKARFCRRCGSAQPT